MKLRNAALLPLILIVMMIGVIAVRAEDDKPLIVEEGTPLQGIPSTTTSTQETAALGYKISTSATDPDCDTGFGGYLDLEKQGIKVSARVQEYGGDGDNFAIGPFFTNGGPIEFYGRQNPGMWITDDGFVIFDPAHYGIRPWEPQILPDGEGPNGVAALLWQNMKIVYNKDANHGVSLGVSNDYSIMVVEFDNVRLVDAPNNQYDMEMVMRRRISNAPGDYEIVFAYDNLNGSLEGPLTIGVENAAGTSGVALVNKKSAKQVIRNGFMVCFDAVTGSPPAGTPSGVWASDGTYEDKIQVTWSDVSQAKSYDVYRADENGNNEYKIGTAANTRFADITAAAGITYTYRVKACNEYGCSSPSPQDTGWRAGDGDPPPPPPYDNLYYIPLAAGR